MHTGSPARICSDCTARAPLSVDVAKLRLAGQSLGLNGSGLATVDMIDRQLTIAFDLPELTVAPDEPSLLNETCGRRLPAIRGVPWHGAVHCDDA